MNEHSNGAGKEQNEPGYCGMPQHKKWLKTIKGEMVN